MLGGQHTINAPRVPAPCSGWVGARAAAAQAYGMLADLKRRVELLVAGWLKNVLEDTSSGGGGRVGQRQRAAWKLPVLCRSCPRHACKFQPPPPCRCCRLVPPACLCRRCRGPPAPGHPPLLRAGGSGQQAFEDIVWELTATSSAWCRAF